MNENEIAKVVVNTAFKIHSLYGPGLLESVYEELMYYELKKVFDDVKRQHTIPLVHETLYIAVAFRADLIVDNKVLLELKSVEEVPKVDYKRMNTYLKLTGYKLGLLINFHVPLIKDGIKRMVNGLED